jgi:hypothetical protein
MEWRRDPLRRRLLVLRRLLRQRLRLLRLRLLRLRLLDPRRRGRPQKPHYPSPPSAGERIKGEGSARPYFTPAPPITAAASVPVGSSVYAYGGENADPPRLVFAPLEPTLPIDWMMLAPFA